MHSGGRGGQRYGESVLAEGWQEGVQEEDHNKAHGEQSHLQRVDDLQRAAVHARRHPDPADGGPDCGRCRVPTDADHAHRPCDCGQRGNGQGAEALEPDDDFTEEAGRYVASTPAVPQGEQQWHQWHQCGG